MSNNISEKDLPSGVHYRIDSHNGLNGRHHFAHVHFTGKSDCVFKIDPPEYIEGKLGNASEKELKKWIIANMAALKEEWDDKDDKKGGRGS